MRELTPGEVLSLREFLTMETTSMINLKTAKPLISDNQLKAVCDSGIQACEGRLRAIQQFIQENNVSTVGEVTQ